MIYYLVNDINVRSGKWHGLSRIRMLDLVDAIGLIANTKKISGVFKENMYIDGEKENFKVEFQTEGKTISVYKPDFYDKLPPDIEGVVIIKEGCLKARLQEVKERGTKLILVLSETKDENSNVPLKDVPEGIKAFEEDTLRDVLRFTDEGIKHIDISSKDNYPCNVLSNLAAHQFVLDGITCSAFESFLQSLKFKKEKEQTAICKMNGLNAKITGNKKRLWKIRKRIYWKGQSYKMYSDEFYKLIDRAYEKMYQQNEDYRQALYDLGSIEISYSINADDTKNTVLSEYEILRRIECLRYRVNISFRDYDVAKTK